MVSRNCNLDFCGWCCEGYIHVRERCPHLTVSCVYGPGHGFPAAPVFDRRKKRLLPSCVASISRLNRPRRLAWPRTSPFHGGNTGSNPVGDAKIPKDLRETAFSNQGLDGPSPKPTARNILKVPGRGRAFLLCPKIFEGRSGRAPRAPLT